LAACTSSERRNKSGEKNINATDWVKTLLRWECCIEKKGQKKGVLGALVYRRVSFQEKHGKSEHWKVKWATKASVTVTSCFPAIEGFDSAPNLGHRLHTQQVGAAD